MPRSSTPRLDHQDRQQNGASSRMDATQPDKAEALSPPSEAQAAFFAKMGTRQELRLLFDHMIGVHFFMKDLEGRFVAYGLSEHQCLRLGAHESILGKTDFDIYPRRVAARVRADDRQVMDSDQPLLNIVELLVNPALQTIDWYVTNKRPLHDSAGRVIGVMGTVQAYEVRRKMLLLGTKLDEGVEYARRHAAENCSVEDLARVACMSTRQLSRKFVEVLGIAPREFLLHTRMKEACDALVRGNASVTDIAAQIGFCDHSAFAVQFRRIIGGTPLEYRQRYLAATRAQAHERG